jgi:DNA-binding LacI/PurR family transcriptional regulator
MTVHRFRYEEIAADLREKIRAGRFPAGNRLPGARMMMEEYRVQRNTVRQALTLLQQEGWLHIHPRSGVFAAPNPERSGGTGKISSGTILVINALNRFSTAMNCLLAGLSTVLEDTPLTIQSFNSQPRPGTLLHILPTREYLEANQVAGAILWAQNPTDLTALTDLRDRIPLLLVDRHVPGFEADCIRFDDVEGGRMVTEHLIARGHRRIGFLGDEAFAETVQQRWRGYTLALETAGIPADPAQIALFEGIRDPLFSQYIRLFLSGGGDPLTAVVCSNDTTALVLLRTLRGIGYRVPEDVAVTGYGNLLPDYMDTIDLTTVEQSFEEVGRAAGELLRDRLVNTTETSRQSFRQIELPVQLIVRNSSSRTLTTA